MFFRRKQQSHDISIDLGNDVLVALKNKEQIPFFDSADLINLFFDNYPRHEKQNIDESTSNIPINKQTVEKFLKIELLKIFYILIIMRIFSLKKVRLLLFPKGTSVVKTQSDVHLFTWENG
jgi:hypothetical protein